VVIDAIPPESMITPTLPTGKKTAAKEHKGRKEKKTLCGCFGRRQRKKNQHFQGDRPTPLSGHR
jgi:hypothetical protein